MSHRPVEGCRRDVGISGGPGGALWTGRSSPRPTVQMLRISRSDRAKQRLVARGWVIHRITDHFPDDAQFVSDPAWMDYGLQRGWIPLHKDGRIVGNPTERAPVERHLAAMFFLDNQQLRIRRHGPVDDPLGEVGVVTLKPRQDGISIIRQVGGTTLLGGSISAMFIGRRYFHIEELVAYLTGTPPDGGAASL